MQSVRPREGGREGEREGERGGGGMIRPEAHLGKDIRHAPKALYFIDLVPMKITLTVLIMIVLCSK